MTGQDCQEISLEKCNEVLSRLNKLGGPKGLEMHSFKVGWYNDMVGKMFHLQYDYDTVAFVVISQPSMFENTFIPFVKEKLSKSTVEDGLGNGKCEVVSELDESSRKLLEKVRIDPLDECMKKTFADLCDGLSGHGCDALHDFSLHRSRRPAVLVQTAGAVSGAVAMYRQEDCGGPEDAACPPQWSDQKVFPVCLHPQYGGWFALRGVLVLRGAVCGALPKPPQRNILTTPAAIVDLLTKYNSDWQSNHWRDVIKAKERYSDAQLRYFGTRPGERLGVLQGLVAGGEEKSCPKSVASLQAAATEQSCPLSEGLAATVL